MPFEETIPHPLTAKSVQCYAPIVSGVYGMSNAREWVYVGQTDNIQSALLEHLRDLSGAVLQCGPTGFVFETCAGEHRRIRQECLILEYAPVCNRASSRRSQSALQRRQYAE